MWTADRLAVQVRSRLEEGSLLVVSNREPYMHMRHGKEIASRSPAQRPGHGARTRAARLRWNLDRAWQRQTRILKSLWTARPVARSSGRSTLHSAPGLANQRRRGRLLLRIRQRGAMAALPHRPHPPALPRRRLGALSGCQPQVRRRRAGRNGGRRESPSC